MKYLFTLLFAFCAHFCIAQLFISPEEEKIGANKLASLTTSSNKPYWVGVGNFPILHFDSSENLKLGIGVGFKANNSLVAPYVFTEHAKVHIRHEGGPGSSLQSQKGPHLLIDEATSGGSAAIRFRQSTLESTGLAGSTQLTPGLRYWDIRAFANASNLAEDNFRIINSGSENDLFNISAAGKFTFTGKTENKLEVKAPLSSQISSIEFGTVDSLNSGKIIHATEAGIMKFQVKDEDTIILQNGQVKIGSNPAAPSVNTWLGTATISDIEGNLSSFPGLPCDASAIIDLSIMLSFTSTVEPLGEVNQTYKLYNFSITNNILNVGPVGSNLIGQQIKIYVVYSE